MHSRETTKLPRIFKRTGLLHTLIQLRNMENISGVAEEGSRVEIGRNYDAGSRQGHWRSLASPSVWSHTQTIK